MVSSSRYTSSEEEEKNVNHLQPNSTCNSRISSSNEEDHKEELNLPLGYRFSPHSNELVMHYLVNKIFSQQLPANIIRDIDFYAYDPHQLPISEFKYGKPNEAYFFTNLEIDAKGQTRRNTKNGYWKTTGRDKETFHNNAIVGLKKILMFYQGKAPKGTRTHWVMHEFRVNPSIINSFAPDETLQRKIESSVVCKVKCKPDSTDNYSWKAKQTNKSAAN